MSTDWLTELKTTLEVLSSAVVTDAWVNEMALYGPEDAGRFSDPGLKFVQANVLELRPMDGQTVHISCAQNDDSWTIWPHLVPTHEQLTDDAGEGTFRTRPMPEFPRGKVTCFQIDTDDVSSIQEIRVTIDQREVIFRAGEVYENVDGTMSVLDRDESVLVFFDGEAYSGLRFNEAVYMPFYR